MAWHRPGDKPLSEPTMFSLPTQICVTRLQWINVTWVSRRFTASPLPLEEMLNQVNNKETNKGLHWWSLCQEPLVTGRFQECGLYIDVMHDILWMPPKSESRAYNFPITQQFKPMKIVYHTWGVNVAMSHFSIRHALSYVTIGPSDVTLVEKKVVLIYAGYISGYIMSIYLTTLG